MIFTDVICFIAFYLYIVENQIKVEQKELAS